MLIISRNHEMIPDKGKFRCVRCGACDDLAALLKGPLCKGNADG